MTRYSAFVIGRGAAAPPACAAIDMALLSWL